MAPPVWARMYAATGDHKYIDYLDAQWQRTSDLLYDKQEHLYARDASYIGKREAKRQEDLLVARRRLGDGRHRADAAIPPRRMIRGERSMCSSCARCRRASLRLQGSDGLWHASLLDPERLSVAGGLGLGAFVYGMAWGVNEGVLDANVYKPVIEKAWRGILQHVYADGRLGDIQQTGAEPRVSADGELYVWRGRLSAGGERTEAHGDDAYWLEIRIEGNSMHSALIRQVSIFAIALFLSQVAVAQAAKDTRSAANMPTAAELKNPPSSWIDKDTGHRIVRLTNERRLCQLLLQRECLHARRQRDDLHIA